MDWARDDISPEYLQQLRNAAEQAWGDDVRHPSYVGNPLPSAGCCYVTSQWLADKLGGYVGEKDGHYVWVSPDQTHVIDLTGDNFAYPPADLSRAGVRLDDEDDGWVPEDHHRTWRSGPILFKRADHPLFKGLRIVDAGANERALRFAQRADAALNGEPVTSRKHALDYMGDPFPGESMEVTERLRHDEPTYDPGSAEYQFVYANGQLQVSPDHSHEELLGHAGVLNPDNHIGPSAAGYVVVANGRATWSVTGNLGGQAFARILKDYSENVGWKWGGMVDGSGNPIHDDFAEKKSRILRNNETGEDEYFVIQGRTAYVQRTMIKEAREIIAAMGYKVAEYPGGSDMNDQLRNYSPAGEDYELFNNGNPSPTDLRGDRPARNGVWTCKHCNRLFGSFNTYMRHLQAEESMGDEFPQEDGQFPEIDYSQPSNNYHEWEPWGTVAMRTSSNEAARISTFDDDWGIGRDKLTYYVAYQKGEPVAFAEVGEDAMVRRLAAEQHLSPVRARAAIGALEQALKAHYDELWAHATATGVARHLRMGTTSLGFKWAKGTDPKDMLDSALPFIYDVELDDIFVGQPGSRHSDIRIPGKFTAGGIVEGTYEPGGKVVIRSLTNVPYSVRHVLDLFYWTHPQLEITSLEMQDAEGKSTKLASGGSPIAHLKTLAATDPTVWNAYQALRKAGGTVYVVGGAVRDTLLGKEPKDIDLMVTGVDPERVKEALSAVPGRVDITGKDFGVFRYATKGRDVEVALPRTEKSTGARRVDFDVQVDHNLPVEDDLLRRDFTVNAMAVNLDTGELVDPYGGAEDIQNGVLDTVHEASFEEDPTRLVRALVASSRHGLVPTEKTRREMEAHAHRLEHESPERIQAELDKLLASVNPVGAFRLAHETGVLKHIFPEVANNFDFDQNNPHHSFTLGEHLFNVLENVSSESTDPDLRLAALLHDIGKPASAWVNPETGKNHYYRGPNGEGANHDALGATMAEKRLRALKFPVARINRVRDLINHHMFPQFSSAKGARKFINRVGDHADDLMTLRWADQHGKGQTPEEIAARTSVDTMRGFVDNVRAAQEPVNTSALSVNGNDVLALGVQPGPEVGRILQALTNDVLEDPTLNERERLLERAQQYAVAGN